jgi:hypothetical protein
MSNRTTEFSKDQVVVYNNQDWRIIAKSNFTTEYGGAAINPDDLPYFAIERIVDGKRLHASHKLLEALK